MIRLGLTGCIGMGKSTTADMFRAEGMPVIDADQIVHSLYQTEAVAPLANLFPEAIIDGKVDRAVLSGLLAENPANFKALEDIVHPLVWKKEQQELAALEAACIPVVVLDIPLLFEKHAEARVDRIVVVTCDPEIQKARVLCRPGMTEEKFALLLSRQMPDMEKRARADFLIDTGHGLEQARAQVKQILNALGRTSENKTE